MTPRLFVYGSLQPGGRNEHVLAGVAGSWQRGTVRGHLREQGWGSAMGFPAIVLDDDADDVPGWLFESAELEGRWEALDAFEGEDYERVRASVRLGDGSTAEAWIYVLRQER